MRRFVLLTAVLALLSPATAEAAKPARSWAQPEIKLVVSRGLMAESVATFKPNAPLTQTALSDLVAGLTEDEPEPRAQQSTAQVTIAQLDAQLVRALGLGDEASSFYRAAAAAGTQPPARFGTEVVARLLGLRKNHEARQDALERLPSDPATRAEAAYSAAQILRFSGWELHQVEDSAAAFELPELTPWQRRILTTAFGRIGFPYVWGGESDTRVSPLRSPGEWRVRLLGIRLARLQASDRPRRCAARAHAERPHGRGNGRRSPAPAQNPLREPGAGRSPLLRRRRARAPSRPLSITWGSTSATAG